MIPKFLNLYLNLVSRTQVDTEVRILVVRHGEKPKAENVVMVVVHLQGRLPNKSLLELGLNSLPLGNNTIALNGYDAFRPDLRP